MKFSRIRSYALVGVAGFLLAGSSIHAQSAAPDKHKVIIYPSAGETIGQLRQQGITDVANYGSYWLVEATDAQVDDLTRMYGARAVKESRLNLISLRSNLIDTSVGEPPVPSDMRQTETKGRRLRLIQFKGPIQPEWLKRVNSVEGVKIINYVPNNAYLVYMDAITEKKITALRVPEGPIQWIGAYHPDYKISSKLRETIGEIDVNVAVVDSIEGRAAMNEILSSSDRSSNPVSMLNQLAVKIRVNTAMLGEFARMPEVLWIDSVNPIKMMDEVQALIISSHTNRTDLGIGGPRPPTSLGGETYLNFLTNAVGGGSLSTGMLPAFTNAATYPIVDVADSGFTDSDLDNDFFPFGNPAEGFQRYRHVYATFDLSCGDYTFAKVTANSNIVCIPGPVFLGGEDFAALPHGTAIASIIAGYNANPLDQDPSGFQFGMGVSPFGLVGSTRVFQPDIDMIDASTCTYNVYDQFCVSNLGQLIQNQYFVGGRISNNSWGELLSVGGNDGVYSGSCQSYDVGVRDAIQTGVTGTNGTPPPFPQNQELIIVFANGNAGSVGNVGGFADITITPPSTAKNVISVGSTENVRLDFSGCLRLVEEDDSYNIAGYSSFGPTRDGRFKPEIVAPGGPVFAVGAGFWTNYADQTSGALPVELPPGDLYSPNFLSFGKSTNYFCTFNGDVDTRVTPTNVVGTSYSAPAVSGAIQLLWWYFQNRLGMLQPSPAMAKAYLLNSARYLPITNTLFGVEDSLPSVAQGMGMLDLRRMFDGMPRVLRDESSPRAIDPPLITTNTALQQTYFSQSGQSYEVKGLVASNNVPFRVTVAWTDAPGTPGNGIQLVNDLDLEVTVGTNTYFGNIFNGHNSVVGGSPDVLNPVESVFLDPALVPAVTSGAPWKVVVRATNIADTGVPHVGTNSIPNQDFALVVYNTVTNNPTVSDVPISPSLLPNLTTNNLCSTAIEITQFPYTFSNTLSGAVYSNVHPSPSVARGGIDEFFKIANPTPGTTFTVNTFGSAFDTVLSVWRVQVVPEALFVRGECGFLAEVAANNDAGGGLQSQLTFTADGSNDYFIVVEPHNDGPGGTMMLNVQVTTPPITVTPASLTFGAQIVGTVSAGQTVTYQNGTVVHVRISTVSITGPNAADFLILSQTCEGNFIAPGTNCTAIVAFAPSGIGLRQANLEFDDDATGSPRIVPLSGTSTPPAPLICLGSSGSVLFSNTAVGVSSAPLTVTITNCGVAALVISNATLSGAAAGDFSVSQNCTAGSIAPGGTCTNSIIFTPAAAGSRHATLALDNNAGSPLTIALQGTGFIPAPAVCVSGASKDFGGLAVGDTGSVQSVTITNCGTATLTNITVTLTGANTGDFIIVTNTCSTVTTGATCQVNLQFAPSAGGARTANLVFSDSAPGSPQLVVLTGSGNLSQPDAAVGKNTNLKKMVGFGTNNVSGDKQEVIQTVHRRAVIVGKRPPRGTRFYVAVRNVGSASDSFLVQGDTQSPPSNPGFSASYFLGSKPSDSVDVTAAVGAGTFSTATMAPGAVTGDATMLRVEVFADKALVSPGGQMTFTLTFTSASDPTRQDAVRVTVNAK